MKLNLLLSFPFDHYFAKKEMENDYLSLLYFVWFSIYTRQNIHTNDSISENEASNFQYFDWLPLSGTHVPIVLE